MLEIKESKQNEVVVLSLKGKMDASTAGVLDGKVRPLVEGGANRVVLDLAELEYISSAGLRDLLRVAKTLQQVSGKFALSSLRAQVKEVFDMAGFSALCQAFATRAEAVAAVS